MCRRSIRRAILAGFEWSFSKAVLSEIWFISHPSSSNNSASQLKAFLQRICLSAPRWVHFYARTTFGIFRGTFAAFKLISPFLWCSHILPPSLIINTRSYAALRAADLDWIVGPGYSSGRYILEKNMKNQPGTWNQEKPWKPTWNYEKPTWNHENWPGTMKNNENWPGTMKNWPGTLKNHEKPTWNHEKPTWNHEKPTWNYKTP